MRVCLFCGFFGEMGTKNAGTCWNIVLGFLFRSWKTCPAGINERFFVGGTNLRGFEKAGIGPRDLSTDDSLGGNQFYRGSVELKFPIGFPDDMGVAGHAFTDVGSLWGIDDTATSDLVDSSSLRMSAGMGLSWASPMGPVRIDLSKPILKEDYDVEQVFRFSFGTQF